MYSILIVDGAVQNTDLISQCLTSFGFTTMTAESSHNALAKVALKKPDLIISEVDLPDISGYDLCKKIKENPETQYIAVLLMSTDETVESRTRSVQVGADDFIPKTFDAYVLRAKVNALLRVKSLSDQLKLKYTELEEKNNLLNFQLKMARQVQQALIPEVDMYFRNIKIVSKYISALDIGGDFYEVIQISEDHLAIAIGDVSGYGISAALLTSMLNMMLKNLACDYPEQPEGLLQQMNSEFYKIFEKSEQGMYACLFYAVIDTTHRKIYYSNAGQTLPVFADYANQKVFELESSGHPIGLMEDSEYELNVKSYNSGDVLFLQTDGLEDNFSKEQSGDFLSSLYQILLDAESIDNPKEIINMVLDTFYKYESTDSEKLVMDDISIVLCKL